MVWTMASGLIFLQFITKNKIKCLDYGINVFVVLCKNVQTF